MAPIGRAIRTRSRTACSLASRSSTRLLSSGGGNHRTVTVAPGRSYLGDTIPSTRPRDSHRVRAAQSSEPEPGTLRVGVVGRSCSGKADRRAKGDLYSRPTRTPMALSMACPPLMQPGPRPLAPDHHRAGRRRDRREADGRGRSRAASAGVRGPAAVGPGRTVLGTASPLAPHHPIRYSPPAHPRTARSERIARGCGDSCGPRPGDLLQSALHPSDPTNGGRPSGEPRPRPAPVATGSRPGGPLGSRFA